MVPSEVSAPPTMSALERKLTKATRRGAGSRCFSIEHTPFAEQDLPSPPRTSVQHRRWFPAGLASRCDHGAARRHRLNHRRAKALVDKRYEHIRTAIGGSNSLSLNSPATQRSTSLAPGDTTYHFRSVHAAIADENGVNWIFDAAPRSKAALVCCRESANVKQDTRQSRDASEETAHPPWRGTRECQPREATSKCALLESPSRQSTRADSRR